jgi:hypothetical protein
LDKFAQRQLLAVEASTVIWRGLSLDVPSLTKRIAFESAQPRLRAFTKNFEAYHTSVQEAQEEFVHPVSGTEGDDPRWIALMEPREGLYIAR